MPSPITVTVEDLALDGLPLSKLFHFEGQLDESNIEKEAAAITDIITGMDKKAFAVMDLSRLTYLNSKTVGYLTFWHVKLEHRGGGVVICGAPENIVDILSVVGLNQIITMVSTLDEAKQAIQNA